MLGLKLRTSNISHPIFGEDNKDVIKRQFSNNFVIIVGISLLAFVMSFHETFYQINAAASLLKKKNSILFFVEDKISATTKLQFCS